MPETNQELSPVEGTLAAAPGDASLMQAVKGLISEHINADQDREKIYQYTEARKNELYWRGSQYILPVLIGGQVMDYTSIGTLGYNIGENEREAEYDYVLNVIRGDGRKFIAVLGQRGPNAKAQPRRPDDEAAVRRARKADIAAAYLRSNWNPERVQRHLAMSLWKNGTTFAYTPWVANGVKYGTVNEPIIESVPMPLGKPFYRCQQCGYETTADLAGQPPVCKNPLCPIPGGNKLDPSNLFDPGTQPVPTVVGEKSYPKGCVELHLATIFEVTVPFYSKCLEDAPWLQYEYEEHKGKLLAAYPQLRNIGEQDWGGDNAGVSAQGKLARDVASSPTGIYVSPRKNRWLYSRFWLRPGMYQMLSDTAQIAALAAKYPNGLKVTMVQGEVVEMAAERLDEVWASCKPDTSEYIFADAVCKDYMGIQDIINDLYNLVVETMERAIPFMIADPLVLDVLQLEKQRGKPGQIIPAKAGVGSSLQDSIFKAPTATVDPQVFQWLQSVHEAGREMVGVLPAIFGGGEPASTARAAELQRNQALQQLNTVWNEMRDFWEAVYQNATRQLAAHALPDGSNLGGAAPNDSDFSDLLGGGWFFTTEEAMPMTWGQKRDLIMFVLQAGPEAWKLFGLEHPLNVAKVQEILGLPDWKVPNLDARDKVLATIKTLLSAQPTPGPPGPPDPMTGAPGPPGPPQPSIPPDQFEDDHMLVASVIKEWAQTEEARITRDMNPGGYANVIAYGAASMQLSGPPPGAPPGAGPSPGGGGPAGPGGPPQPDEPGQPSGVAMPPPPGSVIGGPPMSPPGGSMAPPG
jgi:hypothetical protein